MHKFNPLYLTQDYSNFSPCQSYLFNLRAPAILGKINKSTVEINKNPFDPPASLESY